MRSFADDTLDPQGPAAQSIADLWWLMLGLGVLVFVVFAVALALGLFRRGRDSDDESTSQPRRVSGRLFAFVGVVLPAVIVVVVLVATVVAMRAVPNSAADTPGALEIEVIGHQWWWEVRYPEEGFTTANELHIPVGQPVVLRLSATDVIHSFWVPRLSGKTDMLPDGPTMMVLEADEPGEHRSQCAEFCGIGHANMSLTVIAEPEEQFSSWVAARQPPSEEPAEEVAQEGLDVFTVSECADCHTIRGASESDTTIGPDLTHFAARPHIGATFLPNTRADLADWITDPHKLKPGVKMPATDLSEDDLDALLDYLEGLE